MIEERVSNCPELNKEGRSFSKEFEEIVYWRKRIANPIIFYLFEDVFLVAFKNQKSKSSSNKLREDCSFGFLSELVHCSLVVAESSQDQGETDNKKSDPQHPSHKDYPFAVSLRGFFYF